jgi:Ca2+-binding RTX toxin-like protein
MLGNGSDNSLSGTSSGDSLWGFAGNDTLNGGTGKDFMFGGTGNDLYYVDSTGDVITENAGEGTDTIRSSVAFTLGVTLENLTLTGSGNIKGTGNAADNVIIGNSGNNSLTGLGGADTLDGGSGSDTVIYSGSSSGVNVSLATGSASGGDAQGDALSNIENVTGSFCRHDRGQRRQQCPEGRQWKRHAHLCACCFGRSSKSFARHGAGNWWIGHRYREQLREPDRVGF